MVIDINSRIKTHVLCHHILFVTTYILIEQSCIYAKARTFYISYASNFNKTQRDLKCFVRSQKSIYSLLVHCLSIENNSEQINLVKK